MDPFRKTAKLFSLLALAIPFAAGSLGASFGYFVYANDSIYGDPFAMNAATVMKLQGSRTSPLLFPIRTRLTGGQSQGYNSYLGLPTQAISSNGGQACLFVPDNLSGDIAAFQLPSMVKAGNFVSGLGPTPGGVGVVVRGQYLYALFDLNTEPMYAVIFGFQIVPGCGLSVISSTDVLAIADSMAATPDGTLLLVALQNGEVATYATGAQGLLDFVGSYGAWGIPVGMDITADGKYVLVGDSQALLTRVGVLPINPDGSLGADINFGGSGQLGDVEGPTSLWLSPNEKFLFVAGDSQLTVLNFSEDPLNIAASGCPEEVSDGGMATLLPYGAGGGLYAAGYDAVYLYSINSSTGCLAPLPGSPFPVGNPNAQITFLTASPLGRSSNPGFLW